MARKVKHFRYETTDGKRYLLVAVPVDFGRLVEDRTTEPPVMTEGVYLVVVSDDAYVETDPVGWLPFDRAVMFAHFFIREHIAEIRDKTILKEPAVRSAVEEAIRKIRPDLLADAPAAEPSAGPPSDPAGDGTSS